MGKIIGGLLGLLLLGPLGLIIGAIAGHFFIDGRRGSQNSYRTYSRPILGRIQEMYFRLFFSMLGKLAKADGKVTKSEGDYFLDTLKKMNLEGDAKTRAIRYFNEAKNTSTSITEMAVQFNQLCSAQPQLKRQMLSQLVGIASADGNISAAEEKLIRQVAQAFSVEEEEIDHLFNSMEASSDASYHALGVSKNESNENIKKAYRKLIKEYHPDVLKSKGLPEALMKDAEKRFVKIQAAWTAIKKERAFSE